MGRVGDLLRVEPGSAVALVDVDPRSTPGTELGKDEAKAETAELGARLADLQERLYAARTGGRAGSCSSSRGWTPAARAASSSTSPAW